MTDPYVGKLTFFRVYSGVLSAGSYVYNSTKDHRERIGAAAADAREQNARKSRRSAPGDIAAAIGFARHEKPGIPSATRRIRSSSKR